MVSLSKGSNGHNGHNRDVWGSRSCSDSFRLFYLETEQIYTGRPNEGHKSTVYKTRRNNNTVNKSTKKITARG